MFQTHNSNICLICQSNFFSANYACPFEDFLDLATTTWMKIACAMLAKSGHLVSPRRDVANLGTAFSGS
jgi:hypothetical protein